MFNKYNSMEKETDLSIPFSRVFLYIHSVYYRFYTNRIVLVTYARPFHSPETP